LKNWPSKKPSALPLEQSWSGKKQHLCAHYFESLGKHKVKHGVVRYYPGSSEVQR
jgi:hypothetical protein